MQKQINTTKLFEQMKKEIARVGNVVKEMKKDVKK